MSLNCSLMKNNFLIGNILIEAVICFSKWVACASCKLRLIISIYLPTGSASSSMKRYFWCLSLYLLKCWADRWASCSRMGFQSSPLPKTLPYGGHMIQSLQIILIQYNSDVLWHKHHCDSLLYYQDR